MVMKLTPVKKHWLTLLNYTYPGMSQSRFHAVQLDVADEAHEGVLLGLPSRCPEVAGTVIGTTAKLRTVVSEFLFDA